MIAFFKLTLPNSSNVTDSVSTDKLTILFNKVSGISVDEAMSIAIKSVLDGIFRILLAVLIYCIARWVISHIASLMSSIFESRHIEVSLSKFLTSLMKIVLNFAVLIAIISVIGIDTTSFLALFASAGLAIGMALSGTLQNFAGGVMVLFLKPYQVNDFIEAQGYTGTVRDISLFNTSINTVDNKTIIIPNGGLSTGIINNYSKEPLRRVDWMFGIAYGDNYDTAKELITEILNSDDRILKEPEDFFIALHSLGDSSVNIVVRAWVESDNYWDVNFDINEKIYKRFPTVGLNIPFPQMDIHISK